VWVLYVYRVFKKDMLKSATFVDTLYFSVLTLSTVGYGDSSPDTLHSKLFATVYILVGIGFMSFKLDEVIGNICADIEDLLVRKRSKGLLTFIG
jgi:potassium channel subfamily K